MRLTYSILMQAASLYCISFVMVSLTSAAFAPGRTCGGLRGHSLAMYFLRSPDLASLFPAWAPSRTEQVGRIPLLTHYVVLKPNRPSNLLALLGALLLCPRADVLGKEACTITSGSQGQRLSILSSLLKNSRGTGTAAAHIIIRSTRGHGPGTCLPAAALLSSVSTSTTISTTHDDRGRSTHRINKIAAGGQCRPHSTGHQAGRQGGSPQIQGAAGQGSGDQGMAAGHIGHTPHLPH
jgi:hypothetical protein